MQNIFDSLTLVVLLLLTSIAVAHPLVPPTQPPPKDQVYIKSVDYAGTGCPPNSASFELAVDGSNIAIGFSSYVATAGPDISIKENRKNCLININLVYPQGWSYTVHDTDYRGFLSLDDKVTAMQKSTYFFTGDIRQIDTWNSWVGPIQGDYKFRDTIEKAAIVWSSCDAKTTLNINTQIRVDNKDNKEGSGLITTDSVSHKVTHIIGFQWKKC
ncbi:hypothetical protein BDZ91DRAFT_821825 [Kalaharituber pfeilii]|nr:hypothetical protein BDZ91DRAFT_821825 [Kalaharituber pfeilii]